jgi:ABC-type nitrate/sulfonate/bicarbonate transport system permease component
MKAWRLDWPPLLLLALICALWEVLPRLYGAVSFPPLSRVIGALFTHGPEIAAQVLRTVRRASIGFALALVTMVPLGIVIGRSRMLAAVLEPVIDLLRPLPPIAIVPVVMLFAGIGDGAKIAVITYAAAFPILVHAIDGVRGVHPMYVTVARALRLTRIESRFSVDLFAVLPVLFTGLRLAIASALLVAVTAEMLMSTDGIGLFILHSQERFEMASGLAGILVVAILGWLVNRLVLVADQLLLGWHHATTGPANSKAP